MANIKYFAKLTILINPLIIKKIVYNIKSGNVNVKN